jgi:ferritin-like metal-binding protein YciE
MQTSAEGIDAAIIAGAKAIEKYEMTMYQKVAASARSLGYEGVAKRLQLTFEEERQANTKMSFLQKELVYKTSLIGVPE